MRLEYTGRARRFWEIDAHRWANIEPIPPDDRIPRDQLAARLARHAEALDARLTPAQRDYLWPNYGVPHASYPPCTGCGATTGNSLPGYGRGFRTDDGVCARCYELTEGAA